MKTMLGATHIYGAEECHAIVSVPTHGIKNSLNVATCASVVTWEALRQWEAANEDCE